MPISLKKQNFGRYIGRPLAQSVRVPQTPVGKPCLYTIYTFNVSNANSNIQIYRDREFLMHDFFFSAVGPSAAGLYSCIYSYSILHLQSDRFYIFSFSIRGYHFCKINYIKNITVA